ncbi:MAG: hypothetical protein ACOCTK_02005 [Candidatus Saliniplasma sp.]
MKDKITIIGVAVIIIVLGALFYSIPFNRDHVCCAQKCAVHEGENELLYISSGRKLEAWNRSTGQIYDSKYFGSKITSLTSVNESAVIGTKKGNISFYDPHTGETTLYFDGKKRLKNISQTRTNRSSEFPVSCLGYDGTNHIFYGCFNKTYILGIKDREIIFNYSSSEKIDGSCLSGDGKYLSLWNKTDGTKILHREHGEIITVSEKGNVTECAFSPDNRLAITYPDKLQVYSNDSFDLISEKELKNSDHGVEFLKDGTRIIITTNATFDILNSEDGALVTEKEIGGKARDIDVSRGEIYITTSDRIYIYDDSGVYKEKIQPEPEVPLFRPLIIFGSVWLTAFLILSEFYRRRYLDKTKAYYIEKKITVEQTILLGLLGIFISVVSWFYFSLIMELFIPLTFFAAFVFPGLIGSMLVIHLISRPRPVKIDSNNFYFSTTFFQELYRGWVRKAGLKDIKAIHPDYFYNLITKDMEQTGFEIITMNDKLGKIVFNVQGRENKIRKLKKAMKKAFGHRWKKIYRDEPYVDEEKWKKIGHLAKKKWRWVLAKYSSLFVIPMVLLMIFGSLFIWDFIPFYYYTYIMVALFFLIVVSLYYSMFRITRYVKAVKLKAKKDLISKRRTNAPPQGVLGKEKDDIELDKFLKIDAEEWKEIEKALNKERPLWYTILGLIALFTGLMMLALGIDNFILQIVGFTGLMVSIFSVFYFNKLSRYRSHVKNAVEHELKTGEQILPPDFEIPKPIMGGDFVKRGPIEVTERERQIAETWSGDIALTAISILMTAVVLISMYFLFKIDFMRRWYGSLLFLGLLMGTLALFGIYINNRQRIVAKVDQANKMEEWEDGDT